MADREKFVRNRAAYLVLGDLDKPFHEPECECDGCEAWRVREGRPTRRELNSMDEGAGGSAGADGHKIA